MKYFKIKKKKIGFDQPSFIIAELGINHMGNYNTARKIIEEAFKSGADAVKFQIVNPEESYENGSESYEIFSKYKLRLEDYQKLFKEFKERILFATPGDFSSLRLCQKIGMEAYKISSGLITNAPLVQAIAKLKKPTFISRGMADEKIIKKTIGIFNKINFSKIALLHCVSIYPADIKELNLRSIIEMKRKFKTFIGYSDHSNGIDSILSSISLGACVVEKHFALNKKDNPPDAKVSIEPKEFKHMVKKIREIEKMLGEEKISVSEKEIRQKYKMQRYCVAKVDLSENEKITLEKIVFKRLKNSKNAVAALNFKKINHKRCKTAILRNKIVSFKNLE